MRKANTLSTPEIWSESRCAQTRPSGIIKISLLPFETLLKTHTGRCNYKREESSAYSIHQPTCVTSNDTGQPVIFPRGPFHLIGHAQLIPCVDPEHQALLISRLAEPVCVCVCELCVCVLRAGWAANHREHGGSSSMATQGRAARQGQMKDAGECCRMRAGSWSEGRAAEGEQKIAQPRETETHK